MTITLLVIALVAVIPLARKLVRDCLSRSTKPADPGEKEYWRMHGGQ
jgi:hypothetical protein